ncbi:hypothetical protein ACEN9Z_00080 [Stenotrophomonas geniculata]
MAHANDLHAQGRFSGSINPEEWRFQSERSAGSLRAGTGLVTVEEAAHYCGVSNSQFRKNAMGYGLTPRRFMGKQLYEKAALYAAIEGAEEWQRFDSTGAAARPTSTGRKAASASQVHWGT